MGTSTADVISIAVMLCRLRKRLQAYLLLAKPKILFLVTLTGVVAMVLEGTLLDQPLRFVGVLAGMALTGAAANGLNQYWDRDIDGLMARTRDRRPIPAGNISPRNALYFSLVCGMAGLLLLQAAGGHLAALLGIATIAYYVLVYTVWLKRRTSLNIVIGGAAGAAPPLIGWAAGAGELGMVPLLMFLVILLWTPPHFWALAICHKEDYARAAIPMLPVVAGTRKTSIQITAYVLLLLPATVWLGISANLGWLYFIGSALLGLNLVRKVRELWQRSNRQAAWELFGYSNFYLAAIFLLTLASSG